MIVKNIPFSVNGQTIKFSTMAQLVANSVGIATATFSFSADWSDYDTIKVIFSNGEAQKAVILADGITTVTIPSECLMAGQLRVSAVGLSGVTGEETFKRCSVEKNNGVEVVASGSIDGDAVGAPTLTEWEQILAIAGDAETAAEQANETAQTTLTYKNTYKGLRLARRIVLTEAAATIEFNTDSDGNALNSTLGGELLCYSGENANITTALGYLQINGITASEYWGTVLEPTKAFAFGLWGNVSTEVFSKIRLLNKNVTIDVQSTARYEYGGGMKRHGGGMTTPQTAVTAIKLFLSTGVFPAGTVVEWWERG